MNPTLFYFPNPIRRYFIFQIQSDAKIQDCRCHLHLDVCCSFCFSCTGECQFRYCQLLITLPHLRYITKFQRVFLNAINTIFLILVAGIRKYDHITPGLKKLQWLPVKTQLYFRNAVLAFKCINDQAPNYLSSQFIKQSDVSKRETRSSQLLNIPLFKTTAGQRSFYYRIVTLWNNLDASLKLCESVQTFKHNLRKQLFNHFNSMQLIILIIQLLYRVVTHYNLYFL